MAYGSKWDWRDPMAAVVEAFQRYQRQDAVGYLYRFDAVSYAYCIDPDGDYWGSTPSRLELTLYPVKRWTNTGATLFIWSGARRKHVNFSHNKQFACRTPQQALESYRARKTRQIAILKARLRNAEHDLSLAQSSTQSPLITEGN